MYKTKTVTTPPQRLQKSHLEVLIIKLGHYLTVP